MGRKGNTSQRTKNNAKPSSSGRSAQFLSASTFESQFSLPSISTAKVSLTDTDSKGFHLLFKKMTKRDAVTRIKALQEFLDLVKSSNSESLCMDLPLWGHIYPSLTVDSDNHVRELAHNTQGELVIKVKKNIKSILKQIFPFWFVGQFDSYAPVASAARQSFQTTFPEDKYEKVITFCQDSLLFYIHETLTMETHKSSASNDKQVNGNGEKNIISCLEAYSVYISLLSHDALENAFEMNSQIINHAKFWKLSKHKHNLIRSKWFKLLSEIYQNAQNLIEKHLKNSISTVIIALDDDDPVVLPAVYECLFLIMVHVKDWNKYINIEEFLVPKLWTILQNGAKGNAVVVYPNIVLIAAKLPETIVTTNFANQLLNNLIKGIHCKCVISSKSETNAILQSFIECLQYFIRKHATDETFCLRLIEKHLIELLNWSFTTNKINHGILYSNIAELHLQWLNNSDAHYENCRLFFWRTLKCNLQLKIEDINANSPLNEMKQFLQNLNIFFRSYCIKSSKKKSSVRFNSKEESCNESVPNEKVNIFKIRDDGFVETGNEILALLINIVNIRREKQLLDSLYNILEIMEYKTFWNVTCEKLCRSSDLYQLYDKVFSLWYQQDDLNSSCAVGILFLLYNHLSIEQKEQLIQSFEATAKKCSMIWWLERSLTLPYKLDVTIQKWLKSQFVIDFLINCYEIELNETVPTFRRELLYSFFSINNNDELMLSRSGIEKMSRTLCKTIIDSSKWSQNDNLGEQMAICVANLIYSQKYSIYFSTDLLFHLITISCDHNHTYLNEEEISEIQTLCQRATSIICTFLSREKVIYFIQNLAVICEKLLLQSPLDTEYITYLKKQMLPIVNEVIVTEKLPFNDIFDVFFNHIFLATIKEPLLRQCTKIIVLNGHLSSEPLKENYFIDEIHLVEYFEWLYIKSCILTTYTSWDENENNSNQYHNQNEITSIIGNLLQEFTMCQILLNNNKMFCYYAKLKYFMELNEKNLQCCIQHISFSDLDNILISNIISDDSIWSDVLYVTYKTFLTNDSIENVYQKCSSSIRKQVSDADNISLLHAIQTFGETLQFKNINNYEQMNNRNKMILLRTLLHSPNLSKQIENIFNENAEKLLTIDVCQLLSKRTSATWLQYQEIVEMVLLWSSLVRKKCELLPNQYWDFGVIGLLSWTSNCIKVKSIFEDEANIQCLLIALTKLFCSISEVISKLISSNTDNNYINEWRDLFEDGISLNFVLIWLNVTEDYKCHQRVSPSKLYFLQAFDAITLHINCNNIFKNDSSLKWMSLLDQCSELLFNPTNSLQVTAYHMLIAVIPALIKIDMASEPPSKPSCDLTIQRLEQCLLHNEEVVNSILNDNKVDENICKMELCTDSFTCIFGYLLLWDTILTYFESKSRDLRLHYCDWLRNLNIINNFLGNLFQLMPDEVFRQNTSTYCKIQSYFTQKPHLEHTGPLSSAVISHFACWLYTKVLYQLPTLVRLWWLSTESKMSQIVEKVTSTYVSTYLSKLELNKVTDYESEFNNMTVKILPNAKEVNAIYKIEETQMELSITLPMAYPLRGPEVVCNNKCGGFVSNKQWLIQLKKCLLHRNGQIWDSLLLWNTNLDNRFEGIEECYICYAILHPGTQQLPKLSCQTCKKKFHSACLYKWFSTSNKNSCPLCRNLF